MANEISWINSPTIAKITLPTGTTYYIKDAEARQKIEDLFTVTSGAMHYIGKTTTAMRDGLASAEVVIGGVTVTAKAGDVVVYKANDSDPDEREKEYVYNGSIWQEFGSTGSLKALAFKDSASGTYTPAGNISRPTFSGTTATISVQVTAEGQVSRPTFSGTTATISTTYTPAGSVAIKTGNGTINYTPAGTLTAGTFTGTEKTFTINGTTGTATYTPSGSVAAPIISLATAGTTTTVNSIVNTGTLPNLNTTVSDENLTISWDPGILPVKGNDITVKTGDATYTASTPAFSGNGTRLIGTYTPAGTLTAGTFSGTGVQLIGTFTGTEETISASYQPAGTVSTPSFTGTAVTGTGSYKPAGTISTPSFTGTTATVTVS